MSDRETDGKMKTLLIDMAPLREVNKLKIKAEAFLKSHQEDTPARRDKVNIILNCEWILKPFEDYVYGVPDGKEVL